MGHRLGRLLRYCADLAFVGGFGITLHAVASELYYKSGYSEILSPQGEYIGLSVMLITHLALRLSSRKRRTKIDSLHSCEHSEGCQEEAEARSERSYMG